MTFTNTSPQMLYIHWPFCSSKCHYCDFVAMEGHNKFSEQYHRSLCNEIELYAQLHPGRPQIESIFIGGGTPSLYPLDLMPELFDLLHKYFDLSLVQEITLEVNPGTVSRQHYQVWKNLGITRVSVGVQVLSEKALARLNRYQSNEVTEQLVLQAAEYFPNISSDLIIGLPGVTDDIWRSTVERVVSWPINHVSLYLLTIHEQTPLYYGVQSKKIILPKEKSVLEQYEKTVNFLSNHEFGQYEISNFCRDNAFSVHNKGYWERKRYKGFGLGAASFDGEYRFSNIKNLTQYLEQPRHMSDEKSYMAFCEKLTDEQVFIELIMLGLRQTQGIDLHRVLYSTTPERKRHVEIVCELLCKEGYLSKDGSMVALTQKGVVYENEVVIRLIGQ